MKEITIIYNETKVRNSMNKFIRKFKENFIGDAAFYKMILFIALPILIQNGITSFVGLLDNIMVGQLGTEQMSGVAIVNQLITVYNICIFGALSAASIFGSQFFGQGNHEGVRNTFRFKFISCTILTALSVLLFLSAGDELINLFLHDDGTSDLVATHAAGMKYLKIMIIGLIPYVFTQIYSSTLRETGQTLLPMFAGIVAVFANLILNYLLIFGNFGFPQLGIAGAAIGTIASRFVEAGIVLIWTHSNTHKNVFIRKAYSSLKIPANLVKQIFIKGTPLLMNEALWSAGQAILVQCYSTRGLNAVAALNISTTVSNLFNIVFIALGSALSIVVGQQLGAGEKKKAVDTDRKMIFFSVASCVVVGAILFTLAPLFPEIYNTSDTIRKLATNLIRISSLFMPLYAFYHAAYFTLRSGGKTIITFLFDSCYIWVINIPFAFILSRFTDISLIDIFFYCQLIEVFKAVLGFILLKKKIWVNNIVSSV